MAKCMAACRLFDAATSDRSRDSLLHHRFVPEPLRRILIEQVAPRRQMPLQRLDQRIGQRHDPVLAALAVTNDDRAAVKFQILDAQADAFHQPQTRAILQARNQP